MNDTPILIDICHLTAHPGNPRIVEREDVIAAIEQQIKASGYDAAHAILVRPLNGAYQIVSGHNRVAAARRAGIPKMPAWVREMDDDTAFMELVLSNTQAELSPLERGMHALAATEKGQHCRSVNAYAERVGRPHQSVDQEVRAARVSSKLPQCGNLDDLLNRTRHLAEIHAAPESCWPGMVNRLIESDWSVVETTAAVKTLVAIRPPVGYESIYPVEHLQALHATGSDVTEIMRVGVRAIERARADIRDAQFAVEEHAAQFEAWLAEHGAWDDNAISEQAQLLIKAQRALRHESEAKAAKLKRPITLSEWKTLTAAECEAVTRVQNQKARLNRQDSDSIEWARWSWNPVTGCLHNCPYCYAREIADRFYPQKFEPSFAPEALSAPLNQAPPKEAADNVAYRNIFTCSMADLFGAWVPQEWIDAVLNIARQAKHWNFLMLTKFPQRLPKFEFPENAWVGVTVDCQARVAVTERAMRQVKAGVKWVSIEPLIEPITMDFSLFQWVVIGGASSTAQTPEWRPPRRWVIDLTYRAMQAGCMVYHKTNLNPERLRGYPGFDEKEPVSAPSPFHYLKGDVK